MDKDIKNAFNTIEECAHMWNWLPDINIVVDIYEHYPDSYSVLLPFMYAYMEEVIRSTTSEYGREIVKNRKAVNNRKTGINLVKLAIEENQDNEEYVLILKDIEKYYKGSSAKNTGDNRNSTLHGYMHSRYWSKESFENVVKDIARLSPFARF